ncbi:hypothetical protein [Geobacillus stearothermophilus]|uniref:hypothetical protein n=1 Tax=Geobacillus stearothermophilus TaxID=1422 RepID=UPI002E24D18D|nr:hypothetical protein [Geobacillus stearothermophilus]MED4986005.1 hypothetical protein [Geobacillus stearothermophilus]
MKEALMYAGAFVVALLLIWLLPLGFSRLGGLTAVVMALLAALLAEFASSIIPLWQAGLLVLLLLAAASYLLDRRFGAALYRAGTSRESSFVKEEKEERSAPESLASVPVLPKAPLPSIQFDQAPPLSEPNESSSIEQTAERSEEVNHSPADLLMEAAAETVPPWEQAEEIVGASEPLRRVSDWLDQWPGAVTPDLETAVLDEVSKESGNEGSQADEPVLNAAEIVKGESRGENEWDAWMSMDDRFSERVEGGEYEFSSTDSVKREHGGVFFEAAVAPDEDGFAGIHDIWHHKEGQRVEAESFEDDGVMFADGLEIGHDQDSGAVDWMDRLVDDAVSLRSAAEAMVSEKTADASEQQEEQKADSEENPQYEECVEAADEPFAEEPMHLVASEKAQMAAAELMLSRRRLTADAYEQCLHQCLQAPLSDRDYYVFARLLLEHYALEQNGQQLRAWVDQLERRFSNYPAIAAELALWREIAATLANG